MGNSATIIHKLPRKGLGLLAACAAALALAGCGGIEFQGKVFEYAGLSDIGKPKPDVKMTERAPLLVPPDTTRLPPPGPAVVTPANWPIDSDLTRKQAAAARQEAERKKAAERDPNNPYAGKPNLLDKLLGKEKKKDDTDIVAVPEPDPSDKTPEDRAREQSIARSPAKEIDQSLNAPPPDDAFHPAAPDSYTGMSNPSGNNANW